MTAKTDAAPERIWAWPHKFKRQDGARTGLWSDDAATGEKVYIRATPEALARQPEVKALIAAEREACALACEALQGRAFGYEWWAPDKKDCAAAIRNRSSKP